MDGSGSDSPVQARESGGVEGTLCRAMIPGPNVQELHDLLDARCQAGKQGMTLNFLVSVAQHPSCAGFVKGSRRLSGSGEEWFCLLQFHRDGKNMLLAFPWCQTPGSPYGGNRDRPVTVFLEDGFPQDAVQGVINSFAEALREHAQVPANVSPADASPPTRLIA